MIPVVDFLPLYQPSPIPVHPQLPVPQDFTSSRQPQPPVPLRVPAPGQRHHLFPHLLPRPPIHLQPLLQGGRTNVLPPTHLDSPLPIHHNGMHSAIVICGTQPHRQKLVPEKLQHHSMIRGSYGGGFEPTSPRAKKRKKHHWATNVGLAIL